MIKAAMIRAGCNPGKSQAESKINFMLKHLFRGPQRPTGCCTTEDLVRLQTGIGFHIEKLTASGIHFVRAGGKTGERIVSHGYYAESHIPRHILFRTGLQPGDRHAWTMESFVEVRQLQ